VAQNALLRGSTIWAYIRGPNGELISYPDGNPKPHPALVLTATPEIEAGQVLTVAAISTKFEPNAIPSNWFRMPTNPSGHSVTGLDQPCVVKADWIKQVKQEDVQSISPGVCRQQTRQVLNWLNQMLK